jgi:hypothetical protein
MTGNEIKCRMEKSNMHVKDHRVYIGEVGNQFHESNKIFVRTHLNVM